MKLPPFERAVMITKYYEQWHTRKDYPYIGYGHRIRPGENLTYPITEHQADSICVATYERIAPCLDNMVLTACYWDV